MVPVSSRPSLVRIALACVWLAVPSLVVPSLVVPSLVVPSLARAESPVRVMLKDHHMVPDHITVPAGVRFRLELVNQDDTVDEFESYDLKVEKIVVAGGTATVNAGPLHPGEYQMFDDYHPDTAKGLVTVADPAK